MLNYATALQLANIEYPGLNPRILTRLFSALEIGRISGVAANRASAE